MGPRQRTLAPLVLRELVLLELVLLELVLRRQRVRHPLLQEVVMIPICGLGKARCTTTMANVTLFIQLVLALMVEKVYTCTFVQNLSCHSCGAPSLVWPSR